MLCMYDAALTWSVMLHSRLVVVMYCIKKDVADATSLLKDTYIYNTIVCTMHISAGLICGPYSQFGRLVVEK